MVYHEWHILIFRYMLLKRVQKCNVGTGKFIRHSVHQQSFMIIIHIYAQQTLSSLISVLIVINDLSHWSLNIFCIALYTHQISGWFLTSQKLFFVIFIISCLINVFKERNVCVLLSSYRYLSYKICSNID